MISSALWNNKALVNSKRKLHEPEATIRVKTLRDTCQIWAKSREFAVHASIVI